MTKLMNFVKNHLYINLINPKKYLAMLGVAGSLVSSLSGIQTPIALAEEPVMNSGNAFLTVQPLTVEEKDADATLQSGLFFTAKNLTLSTLKKAGVISVKTSSQAVTKPIGAVVIVTAYSSTLDQTDDSPFITANGTYVRDGIIATNFLPFGTKVKLPEYSGDKVYEVTDRMAKKNSHKIDIWMPTRQAALNFGVKRLAYEIVE